MRMHLGPLLYILYMSDISGLLISNAILSQSYVLEEPWDLSELSSDSHRPAMKFVSLK